MRGLVYSAGLFLAGCLLAVYVSQNTQRAAEQLAEANLAVNADRIFADVRSHLDRLADALAALQALIRSGKVANGDDFDLAANLLLEAAPSFLGLNLIDAQRVIVRVWPDSANRSALGRTVGETADIRALLEAARDGDLPQATGLVNLFQGGTGIVTYHPIRREGAFTGYLNGVLRVGDLQHVLGSIVSDRFAVSIRTAPADPAVAAPAAAAAGARSQSKRLPFLNQVLELEVSDLRPAPQSEQARRELVFGIASAGFVALAFFLIYTIRSNTLRINAMLSGILHTAPTAVIALDSARRISVFNPAAEKMFQRDAAGVLGTTLDQLLPRSARAGHGDHIEQFSRKPEFNRVMGDWRVIRGLRADGEEFPVLVSIGKSYFEGGEIMTAILRDMTEEAATQRKMVELAAERTRQADLAEAANRAKTMFLATMSHELRTPLNAIIGFSDIMRNQTFGPVGSDRYRDYIADINDSGHVLLDLINDILDFSKMEAGAYNFEPEAIALQPAIRDAIRMIQPTADAKRLRLVVAGIMAQDAVFADRRGLRQVLANLLSNAVKFTAPGGTITIGVRGGRGDMMVISVADTGCGISADDLERIGRPFVQLKDSNTADIKGTGLGLAISRKLVTGMAGTLDIRSQPGVGTEVSVTLPAAPLGAEMATA